MAIDVDRLLVETAQKVTITRNADGDINYGTTTDVYCLYRDISSMNVIQNREETTIDGLLWFKSTENVSRGDVYYHSDEGYLRIEKITKAKRLVGDGSIQFIKCEVTKIRQIS